MNEYEGSYLMLTPSVQACQKELWRFIANEEKGNLSLDPLDRGNWTSGVCGIGKLVGSRWGISAAAFPNEDIATMTFDRAQSICMTHYWTAVEGDTLYTLGAAPLAMAMTDFAYNSGPMPAIQVLQSTLNMEKVDGRFGPLTEAALDKQLNQTPTTDMLLPTLSGLIANYSAWRILFESNISTWGRYRQDWVHRVLRMQAFALQFV